MKADKVIEAIRKLLPELEGRAGAERQQAALRKLKKLVNSNASGINSAI